MLLTSSEAFLSVLSGLSFVYCEFVWPGRFFPFVIGSLAACFGLSAFGRMPLDSVGLGFIALASVLFLLEAVWPVDFLAGFAATICLVIGFSTLTPKSERIPMMLSVPVCLLFGGLTVFLLYAAKRARRNKTELC